MSTSSSLPPNRWWSRWQLVFLLPGLALLVVLVRRVGVRTLWTQALGVGWYFAAIVALFGLFHTLRALSWRICLGEPGRQIPFRSLLPLWLAGEGVAGLLSAWWSGEAFRAMATRKAVPLAQGVSAQLVSRALYTYASLCWVTVGILLIWWVVPLPGMLESILWVGTLLSLAIFLLATTALAARGRLMARFVRWEERRYERWPRPWRARLLRFLRVLESDLTTIIGGSRRRFFALLAWNLLANLAGVIESYLVLRGLGAPATLAGAFVIEVLNKLLGVFGYVVPGNLGVREAGNILIVGLFGLTAGTGVNLALIRRARSLVWVLIGALLLIRHGLSPLALTQPAGATTLEEKLAKGASPPR